MCMASGTLTGDESREKQRWGDNKVYTRKKHKKDIEKNNDNHTNNNVCVVQESSQTLATTTEDGNLTQQQQPKNSSRLDGGSDDSSCHNRPEVTIPNGFKSIDANGLNSNQLQNLSQLDGVSEDSSCQNRAEVTMLNNFDSINRNGLDSVFTRFENRVKVNVSAARSKLEIENVRKKLETELELVRSLGKKLEAKDVQINGYSINGGNRDLQVPENENFDKGEVPLMVNSEVGSVGHGLSVVVTESNHDGNDEIYDKDKRTPMSNQYYPKSNFDFAKTKFQYPVSNNKKLKPNGFGLGMQLNKAFKSCSNLLTRLGKHKHSWVFKAPVDVQALNLHDYHTIIKHPMDLGTIRTKLTKRWYNSPREFAEDVRLTFRNAMTYNPKGHEVYTMAEDFLKIFEEKWVLIEAEFDLDQMSDITQDMGLPTLASEMVPPPHQPPLAALSMVVASTCISPHGPFRNIAPKKPKAKNPRKRDMTFEEKEKLGVDLQTLPPEKLDDIIQIIKKKNSGLSQRDDEIELDIDCLDAETLWELDRLVSNYKKSSSKNKRKAEIAFQTKLETEQAIQNMNPVPVVMEPPKEVREDVENVPPASIEEDKQEKNDGKPESSSSSSSDSGSSSSDSDSDSSSSSGSDQGHLPQT